jgi:EAL domain-containing protein (putative c-di-GMP-specific phosphodiesterase class I)
MQLYFLKIDGSIILSILQKPIDAARVAAITKVAKSIGAKTVAELVETVERILKLRELGVDFAQGLGISPPHPMDSLT